MAINGIYNGVISYVNTDEVDEQKDINYIRNIYTGIKWQCVEFIRRYFITQYGLTFLSIKNVYDMMKNIDTFYPTCLQLQQRKLYFLKKNIYPLQDDIVYIEHKDTGHIALVVKYDPSTNVVYLADQNKEYGLYWKHKDYAYTLDKNDPVIIGWARLI